MANDSLKQEACTRQSLSKILRILDDKSPNSVTFNDIPQVMTFSLTFTSSQWYLFWQLLNLGYMLAYELLDLLTDPTLRIKSVSALLGHRFSAQLAILPRENGVECRREGAFKMTH